MYLPSLTTRDAHRLWPDTNDENELFSSNQPLYLFSPACPGSVNVLKAAGRSKHRECYKPVNANDRIDTGLNMKNILNQEYLDSFKKLGYTTLQPIGLNKTMQQLDEERFELEELQRNNVNITPAEFYGNEEEEDSVPGLEVNISQGTTNNEQSVDVMLENSRSMNDDTPVDNRFQFENNQDFMAEDEEYQDDHSISIDSDRPRTRSMFTGASLHQISFDGSY